MHLLMGLFTLQHQIKMANNYFLRLSTYNACFVSVQDHPNVIKLYEYFEDEENVYLVTE